VKSSAHLRAQMLADADAIMIDRAAAGTGTGGTRRVTPRLLRNARRFDELAGIAVRDVTLRDRPGAWRAPAIAAAPGRAAVVSGALAIA